MRKDNEYWMLQALHEAEKAYEADEVPVGAVVVYEDRIIGRGYNQREQLNDPTAHAEIIAITAAANTLEDWRLNNCTLFVTKEPCPMCAGAIVNARLKMVIFGCYDEEAGCCGSLYQLCGDPRFKTKVSVKGGVLEKQSISLIRDFFKVQRST
ncbi:MAG: nucleoside deaminase [Candidatus Marinimicrobia bacterium]|nr:nucleoside deaminase [Candidatus Neomarinimicrobiota bacterium]MBT3947859.1 nucleoside deaminase [Candidatus Neomarinimicrobiota bacterium]MBT4306803.1 nucleoside deaminase [Candidatus Neomarinimicrobiota bacterium]MBT4453241.1 nucleoside deaminase [Candidatus Neomarinimicrobiota bacterium]MBT5385352.1 nucleoside deaminase [Candidatus Neomarinimicrobiota bacterium]